MDTIEFRGLTFRVEHKADDCGDLPWEREEGHGPVRYESRRGPFGNVSKSPGERPLTSDRRGAWLYAWDETMRIAKRDRWGMSPDDAVKFTNNTGRAPTAGESRLAAVQADFNRLRRFLEGDWCYIGIVVTLLDVDGNPTHISDSLWGIESDAYDYLDEVARELATELAAPLGRRKYIEQRTRVRS